MKKLSIVITEIFLVKVGYDKTFVGEVVRDIMDLDVNNRISVVYHGSVVINEGKIWSTGKSQDELGENLDAIATMKLDGNLHGDKGKYTQWNYCSDKTKSDDTANIIFLN